MARWSGVTVGSIPRRARDVAAASVEIDARSLAVFRVVVGVLILADLLSRARNFSLMYTDDGLVPQELATEMTADNAFSVFYFTSDPTLIAALFVLHALFAVQLIVGYKTRLAIVVSFLFVVSLDHQNPLVLSYADVLFRLLLFWAIFLPLGERWSVDALHRRRPARAGIASVASALILSQMVYMYARNGYNKYHDDSGLWQSGEATPKIMGLDEMTFLLGDFVREVPVVLLQLGGLTWYYILILSPLLLVLRGRPRMLFAAMFMGGHATFALTVRIGAFAYVALAGLVLFLQAPFWRDASTVLSVLGLDGAIERLRNRVERAGLILASALPALRFDSERQLRARQYVYSAAIGVLVVCVVLSTGLGALSGAGVFDERSATEQHIDDTAAMVGVDQPDWSVFAPTPRTTDRYYVFPAQTADGDTYDVYNERELTYDRPYDELQRQHSAYRERFYMNSVRRADGEDGDAAAILADHLCTTWPEERGVELTHINMYVVTENVTMETIDAPDERERNAYLMHRHTCGDDEPTYIDIPDNPISGGDE